MKKGMKCVAAVLAAAMCTAALVGCGGEDTADNAALVHKEGYPIVDEPITLQVMGEKAAIQGPWEDMEFFKHMEEMTNIHLEFKTPGGENYNELKNLAFASGEMPDFFFSGSLTRQDEFNYGTQGQLIPLQELIDEYAPNIKEMLSQKPDVKKLITIEDNIYALPSVSDNGSCINLWINYKWLDKLGITEVPQTTDELYNMLVRFKNEDPNGNGEADEIPLSATKMFGLREVMISYFGNLSADIEVDEDGKVFFSPITDNYKEYLKFANKLYAEGLLDSEVYTQTVPQWTAKGNDNKLGVTFQAAPFLIYDVQDSEENLKYKLLPPLTSPTNSEAIYPMLSTGITTGVFAITSSNKYPEATMRWVDWLYSEEGAIYASHLDYWQWRDEEHTSWENTWPADQQDTEKFRGSLTPACGGAVPAWNRSSYFDKQYDVVNNWLNAQNKEYTFPVARYAFPQLSYNEEEQRIINERKPDITSYVEQMEAKFITGVEPIENFDSFVATIQKMGIDEVIRVSQEAYDKYNSTK